MDQRSVYSVPAVNHFQGSYALWRSKTAKYAHWEDAPSKQEMQFCDDFFRNNTRPAEIPKKPYDYFERDVLCKAIRKDRKNGMVRCMYHPCDLSTSAVYLSNGSERHFDPSTDCHPHPQTTREKKHDPDGIR